MPPALLSHEELKNDPRYAVFPPEKFCPKCDQTKSKFDFHVHAVPTPKRGGSPYRIASWCKRCCLDRQKERRASGVGSFYVPAQGTQELLYALYGKAGSLARLSEMVGLSFSSVTMMFERKKVGKVNAGIVADVFEREFADTSDEGIEHFRSIGKARHADSVEKRTVRQTSDEENGLRTCLKCTKRKFVEEFPKRLYTARKRKYVAHICIDCERYARREREGIEHSRRLVPVTPTLVSITERVVAHYQRRDLMERGIWDSLTRGIIKGRSQHVRASSAEKILLAARDMQ